MAMGDVSNISMSNNKLKMETNFSSRKTSKRCLAFSVQKNLQKALKPLVSVKNGWLGGISADQVVLFLVKVAALDLVRRLSHARCPFIWKILQASQVLCYRPFRWIQRWAPLNMLVRGLQKLSGPMFLLTVSSAVSGKSKSSRETQNGAGGSHVQMPASQPSPETRTSIEAIVPVAPECWLQRLKKELDALGIALPGRINDDELCHFYTAANGDFSHLLSSVKKTIRWRETYKILSLEELEIWSHLVFWHGCDFKSRPCLVIRLGLACSSLAYHDRPRFAQAVVSQIENGVLHLLSDEDPRITVLMDCEGVSTFKFPMQMMRSCSILLQDHYPGRLALMFIVRLPPIVRVIAHTLIQVLRPSTRQKLHIIGETYHEVLSEHIQMAPSFLGRNCPCDHCHILSVAGGAWQSPPAKEAAEKRGSNLNFSGEFEDSYLTELPLHGQWDQIMRTTIISILMLWIFIAFIVSMYSEGSLSSWASS